MTETTAAFYTEPTSQSLHTKILWRAIPWSQPFGTHYRIIQLWPDFLPCHHCSSLSDPYCWFPGFW